MEICASYRIVANRGSSKYTIVRDNDTAVRENLNTDVVTVSIE